MERAILESRMCFTALLKLIEEEWEEDVLLSKVLAAFAFLAHVETILV
jgi:hypothetical protein